MAMNEEQRALLSTRVLGDRLFRSRFLCDPVRAAAELSIVLTLSLSASGPVQAAGSAAYAGLADQGQWVDRTRFAPQAFLPILALGDGSPGESENRATTRSGLCDLGQLLDQAIYGAGKPLEPLFLPVIAVGDGGPGGAEDEPDG